MNCNGCHWFESSGCPWVLTVHAPRHAAKGKDGKGQAENPKGHVCGSRFTLFTFFFNYFWISSCDFCKLFPGSSKGKSKPAGPVAPGPVLAVKAKPMPAYPPPLRPAAPKTPPPVSASWLSDFP